MPLQPGYCAVKTAHGVTMKHRSCQCDTSAVVAEPHLVCKKLCNKDNDCKGYSYRPTMNTCEYYTVTQPCATNPVTCTPIGFSIADNIGKIFTEPEIDEKGCYIKEKRKSQRHIVIQIKRFIQLFLYIQILVFFIRVNIFFIYDGQFRKIIIHLRSAR